ncbi:RNA polymerase sigma factor [Magnetospirillum aberrantis]|uniref:Sigma-70 family RNA polymerase sigma factor n=1 Tax=Magnetospirillum aberrantis SpK TaxID=908842 RepID=A0A7C9QT64_9PROT|nr:sigma-70 family RNA polymerase sigma factor [Magnetospirillum aberrantis]NFV78836.1 sigma-70 family RNA polymerase sigma factor [Magnetospirillum aberrantis SpK]
MADDLDSLFRQYHAELQRLAFRRVGDHDVAADVVQDAFLRYAGMACGERPVQAIENPRFFLWRIVVNLVADFGRGKVRRGIHDSIDAMADTLADGRPTPEQVAESRQRLARLRQALEELPPQCRAALLLNRLEGLTHAEVGRRLGISSSMVSKHIMRAVRHCARRLGWT